MEKKNKKTTDILNGEDPNNFEMPEITHTVSAEYMVKEPKECLDILSRPQEALNVKVQTIVKPEVINKDEKKEEPPKEVKKLNPVGINERGIAAPIDLDSAFRMANALFKGSAFPKWVRSSEQALAVSLFLKNLGLEVMTGIQHVCEVNGRLTLWGEGPLAAVRASGKLNSIKEYFLTKDYKEICLKNKNLDAPLFAAVCVMTRIDGERVERSFTNKDEDKAEQGVAAIWSSYQRIMYKRKARAECIKDLFGDVVLGAGIAEYDFNGSPDTVPPEQENHVKDSLAENLTQRLLGPAAEKNEKPIQN